MKKHFKQNKIIIFLLCLFLLSPGLVQGAEDLAKYFSEAEREYIRKNPVIKAASITGAAPLSFLDSKNQVQGIAKRVLDEVSSRTGLVFEYKLYDSVAELLASDADIVYGIPEQYAPEDMKLSLPFLRTEAILYLNSSLDVEHLDDKIYAAVEGSALPVGIKEENTIYFKTREESLNAVEKGIADYGYGNAYSVGYYVLHNNYKNILTIPQAKESREYSIGLLNGDEILLGIINMALIFIDDTRIHTIVLDVASGVEQKITPGMIFEIYGIHIFMVSFLIILVLLYSVVSNIKAKRVLELQNKKYEVLSQISNEYLFEYNLRTEELKLSDKFNEIFGSGDELEEVKGILKSSLLEIITENNNANLEFTLLNEEKGVFRVFSTRVFNEMGKIDFIIGKLIDISEDVEERESLLLRSQLDGLTGLYNASTSKELIIEQINAKPANRRDAFVLIDCDDFKGINDQQGHLAGDKVLKILANILKKTFRNTDIIGRIGGDEFCVYLLDVSSLETLKEKCRKINKKLKKTAGISVSIGVALPGEKDTYEDVFKKADQALYAAKNKGKAQCAGAYQEDRDTAENGN